MSRGKFDEAISMLKPDEDQPAETRVELESHDPQQRSYQEGPQSPVPTVQRMEQSNNGPEKQRKLQFNMASKIQIIPNNRQGQLNTVFLATVPGVLKMAEIALCFVSFILAICSDRSYTASAWAEHISFECLLVVSVLLLLYVVFPHLSLRDEQTREGLIVVELLFYGINTLFFFIGIWLMIHLSAGWNVQSRGAAVFNAILCVALTVLFGIETFIKLKAWKGENTATSKVFNPASPGNAELRRSTEVA
uniref:MARVEL domain-containing protein n=1 Tax=Steinernema glaseri TaxID=37863 RepID=A0A1I8AWC9_9BILA